MANVKKEEVAEDKSDKPEEGEKGNTEAIAELTKRIESAEANFKREQGISSKKDLKIQELGTQLSNRDSSDDLMRSLVGSIAEQKGVTEEEFTEDLKVRKTDYLAEFDKRQEKRKQEQVQNVYNARANSIWEGVKDLPDSDENRTYVYDMLMAGLPDKAEAKINQMSEKSVEPLKPSEEDVEEAVRQKLEEKGLLNTDLPTPAGSGKVYSPEEIAKLYKEASTPGGLKRLNEMMPELVKATKEGRL